jgi:hypothetical protein
MKSELHKALWTTPRVVSFSGRWNDLEAAVAPNGRYLIFASERPATGMKAPLRTHYYGKDQIGGPLWRVDIVQDQPGVPYRLPLSVNTGSSVWTPSIAANNDLFFMHTDPNTGRFRLLVAPSRGVGYKKAVPLVFSTGDFNDVDPAIDPQQRFLIFSSDRALPGKADAPGPERLFIAFAPTSPQPLVCPLDIPGWSDPTESQVESRLSPDKKLLYFASRHPDHAANRPPTGAWDNGSTNIWVVALRPALWRARATEPAACFSALLPDAL